MQLGVVLAGGQSRRMGCDKGTLSWQGKSLLQRAVNLLESIPCDEVVISGQGGVGDIYPNRGPVGGIISVVTQRQLSQNDSVLVLPIDMPLLDKDLLVQLLNFSVSSGQSCYFDEYYLPLSLVVTEGFLQDMKAELERGRSVSVRSALRAIDAKRIPCQDPDKFLNVNCPEDWQQLTLSDD